VLEAFLDRLGYGLCHQLPDRSFFGGGVQVPVCARDTGIYVGFVVSLAVLAWIHRDRPRGLPGGAFWVTFGLAVAYMGWDGVTSYAGLRDSNNLLRLTSGMGVGYCCAALIVPMLNDVLWYRPAAGRVLGAPAAFAIWLTSGALATAVVWWLAPLSGLIYPVVVAACILVTLASINLVIVGMFPAFDRRAVRARQLAVPATIALAVALVEVYAAGAGRGLLEAVVQGLA